MLLQRYLNNQVRVGIQQPYLSSIVCSGFFYRENQMKHTVFMKEALIEAKKAYENHDVPVGAVVVYKDEIIARTYNKREVNNDPTAHAEILALKVAGEKLQTWNLSDCTLYVTLEPCIMCAGAMIQSRIGTVVFGAFEPKGGSFGSTINLNNIKGYNHYPEIIPGIMEEESKLMMQDFFKERRREAIIIKHVTNQELLDAALKVRKKVFVEEQHVDESLEYDAYDILETSEAKHIVALQDNEVVGTLRVIPKGHVLKVGRVAVLKEYRGLKVGAKLMESAHKFALNSGYSSLKLDAQLQAIPFYEKMGYTAHGEVFLDAGIEHREMTQDI